MANTKAQYVREIVIDECLSGNRNYTLLEIMKKCNDRLYFQGFLPVSSKQTILDDFQRIETQWGFNAQIESIKNPLDKRKNIYRYKDPNFRIYKTVLAGDDLLHLEQLISLLENFKGLPPMGWLAPIKEKVAKHIPLTPNVRPIIELEGADLPEWSKFLSILAETINEYVIIKIEYKPFGSPKNLSYDFRPCYLRQFNGRWFLYGFCVGRDSVTTIALDRIQNIVKTETTFDPISFDPTSFFHDVVGATVHQEKGTQVEEVRIQVLTKKQLDYIKTKPLHCTQIIESEDENGGIVCMRLILNYELEKLVMSFGEKVKVLAPENLVQRIKERVTSCLSNYDN